MLRAACTLAILLLVPHASADTGAEAFVGPEGGYWLKATVSEPEAPRESDDPKDDCASTGGRPATAEEGALRVAQPFTAGEVPLVSSGTTAPYVPGCVAAPATTCPVPGAICAIVPGTYASYDVATGRYYVEIPVSASASTPVGPRLATHGGMHLTGTSGVSGEGDCEGCPPPFALS